MAPSDRSPLEFHVGLLPDRPISEVVDLIVQAESLGFDGAWIADSQLIFRDAFTALTLSADRTERILVGTGVTNPVTRHPSVLASQFASLDELYPGRIAFGIGVGASAVETIGLGPARLVQLTSVIEAVNKLMAGEEAEHDGATMRMRWSARQIPVVIACSGPRSLRLAGRIADGVMFQVGSHPDLVRWAIDTVRLGAREEGRSESDVKLYARLGCAVSEDGARAREELKGYAAAAAVTVAMSVPRESLPKEIREDLTKLHNAYDWYAHASHTARHREQLTDDLVEAFGVAGTPHEVAQRLAVLGALGLDGFVIPVTMQNPAIQMFLLSETAQMIPAVS